MSSATLSLPVRLSATVGRVRSVRSGILVLVIVVSTASFVWSGVWEPIARRTVAADFIDFYTAGQLWNEGRDPYDSSVYQARLTENVLSQSAAADAGSTTGPKPIGYPYSPLATVLFALLARLPLERAFLVMMAINVALLASCLMLLAHVLARFRPIGLAELALLAALANTGFARTNVSTGQSTLFACVLLLTAFLLATSKRSPIWAGLALGGVSAKPSFLPLFLAYHGLRKAWLLVLSCAATVAVTVLVPLLLTNRSLLTTAVNYRQMLQVYTQNPAQDSSPFLATGVGLINLAPLVNRIMNAESLLTAGVSWAIIVALCGWMAYLTWRSHVTPLGDLLDFSILSMLSLLAVSHRHYDQFLMFPGIVYLYVGAMRSADDAGRWGWLAFVGVVVLAIGLPNDASLRVSDRFPALLDSYAWRVVAPFQTWAGVALTGALVWLKTQQVRATSKPAWC
jgi:hypothetical protein